MKKATRPAASRPAAKPSAPRPSPAPAKRTPPPPRKPAPSRKANPAPVSNKPALFPSALVCLPCLPRDTVGKIGLAVFRFLATLAPWRLLSPLAAEKAAQAAADRLREPRTPRAPFPFVEILAILPRPVPERIGLAVFRALRAGDAPHLADRAENAIALAACARLRNLPGEEWAALVYFFRAVETAFVPAAPLSPLVRLDRLAPLPSGLIRGTPAGKGKPRLRSACLRAERERAAERDALAARLSAPAAVCALPDWQARAFIQADKARRALAAANKALDDAPAFAICDAIETANKAEEIADALARVVCRLRPLPGETPSAPANPAPAKRWPTGKKGGTK